MPHPARPKEAAIGMPGDTSVTVGLRVPYDLLQTEVRHLSEFVAHAEAAGLDRLCLGDHVTFKGGHSTACSMPPRWRC